MNIPVVALLALGLLGTACKKPKPEAGAGSGSAAEGPGSAAMGGGSAAPPTPAVSCQDAAKAYTKLMAEGAGNELSAAKFSDSQLSFVRVTFEEDCDNGWTPETRACVVATKSSTDIGKCWPDGGANATVQVHGIVEEMKARKAAHEAEAGSGSAAGSGSGSAK